MDVSEFVERLSKALEKGRATPTKRGAKQQVADIQASVSSLEERATELQAALDHSVSEEEVEKRVQQAINAKENELFELKRKLIVELQEIESILGLPTRIDGFSVKDDQLKQMEAALALVTPQQREEEMEKLFHYAPMSKVKKAEERVENNTRVSGTGKKLFRALVEEYADFPNGLSMVQLANFANMKMNTMVGGGGRRALMDLRDRRYITISGNGESAIVAINPEMLR